MPSEHRNQNENSPDPRAASRVTDDRATADDGRLREIEARYRALTESIDAAVILMTSTVCVDCNPATLKLFGLSSRDEIIGKTPLDFAPPRQPDGRDSSELVRGHIEQALAKGLHIFEWTSLRTNGEPFHQEVRLAPYRIGEEQYFQCIVIDITERKRAEAELRESEEKFSKVFRKAPLLITLSDVETGRFFDVNEKFLDISGYAREEVVGRTAVDIGWISGEQRARMVQTLRERGGVAGMELSLRRKDGREVICLFHGELITVGGTERLLAIAQDITERKQAERKLAESQHMLRNVIDAIPVRVFWKDRGSRYLGCNNLFARDAGRPHPDRLLGEDDFSMGWAEQAEAYRADDRDVMRTGTPKINYEEPQTTPAGDRIWLRTSKIPLRDEGGTVYGVLGTYEDITDRKRMEEALRESERSLKTLMGNLPGMAYRCRNDRNRTMEYVSEGAVALTGFRPEDLVTNAHIAVNDLIHPDDQGMVWDTVQEAVGRRQKYTLSYRIRAADGREKWVWEQGQGVFSEAGDLLALEGFIIDVSDRRLLEEERLKAQKLESIGTLAGGIAHDFNNLLQGVFGYVSIARLTIDRREEALAMLGQAEKALHQTVNLTSQLLTFSKGGRPVKKLIDLRPLIESAAAFSLSGSRTGFRLAAEDDLWCVEADEGQIGQVVQNIVLNADQAMPGGGAVRISARNVPEGDAGAPQGLGRGNYVEVSISDSGIGIPAEHLTKIFDPYFTTKEKGSGLGLATAYSIIRNHGGRISARSSPGSGSTFTFHLPAVTARAARDQARPAPSPGRPGRVLVMDDEVLVLKVARELIQALGHEVELAEHGEEAITKYGEARAAGQPFDVVILDLTIRGGMGGSETMRKLRAIDPGVKAVVSSGYSDDTVISRYREHGFRAFLKKPYDIAALQRTLSDLIE